MQVITQSDEIDPRLQSSINAALVDSLFQNPQSLGAGAALVAMAAALTATKTGLTSLWCCVGLLVLSGGWRTFDMYCYRVGRLHSTPALAQKWEMRYQFGAILYAAALGLWCAVGLLATTDTVVHMISIVVTVGYIAGGVGRTFGRPWIYHLQIALSFGITSIALILHGTIY